MQLPQEDLSEVKRGEADPHRYGSFDPVHAETLVESTDDALLRHNLSHCANDRTIRVTCDPRSLHTASDHIQGV